MYIKNKGKRFLDRITKLTQSSKETDIEVRIGNDFPTYRQETPKSKNKLEIFEAEDE